MLHRITVIHSHGDWNRETRFKRRKRKCGFGCLLQAYLHISKEILSSIAHQETKDGVTNKQNFPFIYDFNLFHRFVRIKQ